MVINDGELETDLPFASFGTPIYGISWYLNLSFLNRLLKTLIHASVHLFPMFHMGIKCLL